MLKNSYIRYIIFITGFFYSVSFFAQSQSSLKITHLSGDYYIYTTYRSYKGNLASANGLYLLTSEGAMMIDTPWDTAQFQPLLDSIKIKHKMNVVLCIATHSHEDRTGGLEFLKQHGVKTYSSKQTDAICKEHNEKRAEFCFTNDTVFNLGQYSFQTFYGGEGHTKDNIVIWFAKDKILYGGCVIKSTEATDLGYIGEANLKAWPITLTSITKKFRYPEFIIPGHQSWASTKSISHTLKLLQQQNKTLNK